MAAVAAIRANPDIKIFYQPLRNNGNKPKVTLTAVMRKLVILANTLSLGKGLGEGLTVAAFPSL